MTFDFSGILAELETKLSAKSEWKKTFYHGVYRRINSVIAYVLEKYVFLTETYFKESSWDLAEQKESLMARTDYYWYNPHRKIGASGYVQVSADENFSSSYVYTGHRVIIPKWTEFSDEDNEIFVYSTEEVLYNNGTVGDLDVPVKEGIPKEFIYIASGISNEVLSLNFDDIDNEEVYVYLIDASDNIVVEFTRCELDVEDKLFFIQDMDNYYCSIKNNFKMNGVDIRFGDGVKTKQLALGNRVLVEYIQTKGSFGDITNSGTITEIVEELEDIQKNTVELFVTNTSDIVGGADEEDIESIRYNASYLFNSGYRLGGEGDWKTFLENQAIIYKAMVWSAEDVYTIIPASEINKIYITAITTEGDGLTSAQQDSILLDYIKDKKSLTEIVDWQTLKKVYAIFDITAVIDNVPTAEAIEDINENLESSYSIFNTDFRKSIYESNFYSNIDSNDFVFRHTTQIRHGELFEAASVSNQKIITSVLDTEESDPLDQIYIKPVSVQIWMRKKSGDDWLDAELIGYEVVDTVTQGEITDNAKGYVVSGTVIYAQNEFSYTIATPPTVDYEVMVTYITQNGNATQDNDLRLPQFDLITDVEGDYNQFTLTYE